jgi:hypothetical protein
LWSSGSLSQPAGLFRGKFLVLDSIRSWNYHLYVMGGIDFEHRGRARCATRKSKLLSLSRDFDLVKEFARRTTNLDVY